VLGPAITPLFLENNLRLQFVESALLVHDPGSSPSHFLHPLGIGLGYSDPPREDPNQPGVVFNGGHAIYEQFVGRYEQLGGAFYVGRPLTEVRVNVEKNRLEQHFANLGLYVSLDDPGETVRLLAYGVFSCDHQCRYRPQQSAVIARNAALPEPFGGAAERIGNSFLGEPLTDPYYAPDGNLEIIFENMVLYSLAEDPAQVRARPIVPQVGFEPQPLVERMNDPLVYFYSADGQYGHNVPVIFNDYLRQHGGLEIAGDPISEVFPLEEGVFRQCFTNLCLDYYVNAEPGLKLRPAPLGFLYNNADFFEPAAPTAASLSLLTWDEKALVTSQESQTIHASVFENDAPVAGQTPTLTLILPDGKNLVYVFPPTSQAGQTQMSIPPLQAANGTLIFYEVCLDTPDGARRCEKENYLIWGN
jgi:hypothetical protein